MHQKFVPDFVGCIVVKMALLKEIISCVGIALTSLSAAIRGKKQRVGTLKVPVMHVFSME